VVSDDVLNNGEPLYVKKILDAQFVVKRNEMEVKCSVWVNLSKLVFFFF